MNDTPSLDADVAVRSDGDTAWLKLVSDAYQRSTTYFDNNYKKRFENDLRMFQSRHPSDSKYSSDAYKFRSRIFRPKSRSVLRKNEATAALAFFSNPDVVTIEPENSEDMAGVQSSVIVQALLQYRLTKTIPWFLTVIGGFQDTMNVGLAAAFNYWDYQEKMVPHTMTGMHPQFGEITIQTEKPQAIVDKPCVDLIPIEYIRFDPAAKWYNVAQTSPYLILQIPMYVNDILDRMESGYGESTWRKLDKETILKAKIDSMDSLRSARNENRDDPQALRSEVNEFDVVMVHLNFIRQGGECYAFYTLSDSEILSEPMPVGEMFLHCKNGDLPIVIGFCVVETHKSVPTSLIGLTAELQREANEISNQRLDNVKYVLNKRNLVRRGANVDVESLLRNVPGGVTMVNDVERDIREVNWQDVTSSSYQEQDRVNVDFDELAGNFAQGSVMTNRKLNETVGGMRMMAQGANMLTEYTIRVYVETFIEPLLRQIVKLEMAYETDMVVLANAASKAQFFQKFGVDANMDELLNKELTLSVNVGMGATDPDTRFQRLMQGFGAYSKLAMEGSPDLNLPEVRKEIFGLIGFKDAPRFFQQVDPRLIQAKKMMDESERRATALVVQAHEKQLGRERDLDERETKLSVKEIKLDDAEKRLHLIAQLEREKLDNTVAGDGNAAKTETEIAKAKIDADAKVLAERERGKAQVRVAEVSSAGSDHAKKVTEAASKSADAISKLGDIQANVMNAISKQSQQMQEMFANVMQALTASKELRDHVEGSKPMRLEKVRDKSGKLVAVRRHMKDGRVDEVTIQ